MEIASDYEFDVTTTNTSGGERLTSVLTIKSMSLDLEGASRNSNKNDWFPNFTELANFYIIIKNVRSFCELHFNWLIITTRESVS